MSSAVLHLDAGQEFSFSGPAGPAASRAGWDSAILVLQEVEDFTLELWNFRESYRVPAQGKATGEVDSFGQPRASERHLEETRVTLTGSVSSGEVPAVQLRGFSRREANQDFALDTCRLIDDAPTWWSWDGLYFLYFSRQYLHWKLNALRIAGGDGLEAVQAGGRKAGHGYVHSGSVGMDESSNTAVLTNGDGWFECVDDEWEPLTPEVLNIHVQSLDFQAKRVEVQDRVIRGGDSSSEKQVAGALLFRGWCHAGTKLRLMLPEVLQTSEEGDIAVADSVVLDGHAAGIAEMPICKVGHESGYRGDPDVLVLEPMRSSKL